MFFAPKFAEFFPEELFIHGFPSVRVRYGGHYGGHHDHGMGGSHHAKRPSWDDYDHHKNHTNCGTYTGREKIFPERLLSRTRKTYPTGLTIEEVLPDADDNKIEEIIVTPDQDEAVDKSTDILSEDILQNLKEEPPKVMPAPPAPPPSPPTFMFAGPQQMRGKFSLNETYDDDPMFTPLNLNFNNQ